MVQGKERIPERWTYDVFLSFRGADVRKNFLSHLYDALKRCGIRTFMDDVELEKGEYISPELLKAIETSKILIVVLTKDYASSAWCLDELVHIMKSHKSNSRHLVFPIFFYADPSDIRRQKGSYAKSFSKHKSRYPSNKVKVWREALTEVANISGWDVRYRNEAECIADITGEILKRLPCQYLHVPSYAVGMRSRLQHISSLLSISSDDVRVIGIYGMGGIGKTTLAKVAFNEFSHHFEGSSFLENFREYSKKPEGRTHLQHQLLSDILRRNDIEFNSLDHAIKERFCNKRVLIVVDDVDDINQLNSTAIDRNCFGHGSRIIITTRNMHLLKQLRVEESCSPKELDSDESLELFSWHAFRASEPPKEFLQLSEKVVAYCAGLPLAMEVLGAFLIERSIPEWESMLELLKQVPYDNIQAKLQISFDALNSVQRDVFLDIACFFIGMDRDYVACILDGCNLYPDIVLNVLMERCLISVSGNNIMMHDLLRDMGRQIVREISPKSCGERSRLWNLDDASRVLRKKSGTNAIEGLSLKAEVMDVQYFEVEAFAKMQELRLLQLSYVNLNGSYEHFPKDLRWLSWHGLSSESFPTNLSLGNLVVLDMQYSNFKQFWKAQVQPQWANMLKYLDLSHSVYLRETPDFSYFPNVEKLLLINCKSLVQIHKSIGILHKKLVLLNLSSCIELDALPEELYQLKSLQTLVLSNCLKLERLDDALGELESLITLVADFTALREIPFSINKLKKLEKLSLNGCKGLLSDDIDNLHSRKSPSAPLLLPISLNGLGYLKTLSLSYCNLSDELIPKDIESLSFLQDLDLRGNNFVNLQTDFVSLINLYDLRLSDCSTLQSILSLPRNLTFFDATKCISLERLPDLSKCVELLKLDLRDCLSLVETPGIHKLETLSSINMERCNNLASDATIQIMLEHWLKRNHKCIYLPGHDLPNWVSFKEEMRSFSFTVPETHNSNPVVGFTLWMGFVCQMDNSYISPRSLTVKNLTRGGEWIHRLGKPTRLSYSNLLTNAFRIETGDQMEVDVDCDDRITVFETGFALAYNARDPSDFCFGDIQFTFEEDILYYTVDGKYLRCRRKKFEQDPLQAVVHFLIQRERGKNGYPTNEVVPDLYACSFFPETSRYQENNQPVVDVEESHRRPRRKMRMGLRTILGAAGFLTLVVVLGKYGKPLLSSIRRRL
ncbi:P-loop containing nucleoside triphosphate hydrolase [Arabidopsis thaliana x Arabidopsis arenosa]|uniref:P-loop containing nucleoside triphosphate hydrolase n=1 Tax=Arabidopsis thaliana x Arabidopsis arenosa TaxID=1240361 RepID=A0A8T1Y8R2_9BRAS|nr:P-loop containing nucleoside triphosphate hydrolase [Arabidopsis thaliana x Arabidopsis arenosa]